MKLKKLQMLQSRGLTRQIVIAWKMRTVEEWTFQLITPRSAHTQIILDCVRLSSRHEAYVGDREMDRREGGKRTRGRVTSRNLSISQGRENFLNYISRWSALPSSHFPYLLPSTLKRVDFRFSHWINRSTMHCGSNNDCA